MGGGLGRLGEVAFRSRGGWYGFFEVEEEKYFCVYFLGYEKIFFGIFFKVVFWKY